MSGIKALAGPRREYRIYPSIGIARLGNSKDGFFLGPEAPGVVPEGPFRAADGIKPQGARFRIYRVDIDRNENETVVAEVLPKASVEIKWTVQLANRKAAGAKILDTLARNPKPGLRNKGFNRRKLVISAEGSIEGTNSAGSPMTGSIEFARGKSAGKVVKNISLATLRTDANGRLIVVGGAGVSGSPFNSPLNSFADNDGWYDSVSTGRFQHLTSMGVRSRDSRCSGAWWGGPPPYFFLSPPPLSVSLSPSSFSTLPS